jgi:hypothetical protein
LASVFVAAAVPLFARSRILEFFDPDLFNERYWNFESQSLVFFFGYRRAMALLNRHGASMFSNSYTRVQIPNSSITEPKALVTLSPGA